MRHNRAFASLAIFLALLVIGGCGGGSGGGASSGPQTGPDAPKPRPRPVVSPYTAEIWSATMTPADGGDRGGGQGVSPSGYCRDGVCGQNIDRPAFGALTDDEFNFEGTAYVIESIRYGFDRELKLDVDPIVPTHLRAEWALRIGAAEFPLRTTFLERRNGHEVLIWDVPDNPDLALSRAPWTIGTPIGVRLAGIPPAEFSVADASVREEPDAKLAFVVSLGRAIDQPTSVDYATSDGTATAGADYTHISGRLIFAANETEKTVEVPVLDDGIDEGSETLFFTLFNSSGAEIGDGSALGTIDNSGAMPRAWLARFGRSVGSQVVDAVTARLDSGGVSHATLAGRRTEGTAIAGPGEDSPVSESAGWRRWPADGAATELPGGTRGMTGRELLLGSSFHLSGDEAGAGGAAIAAWGRMAVGSFDSRADDASLDGDVTTGFLGVDAEWERVLAGVLLSHSEGEGSYGLVAPGAGGNGRGTVESRLTGVYPYARLAVGERLSAWGLAGYGTGELTLAPEGRESIETDLSMQMVALGARGVVLDGGDAGSLSLSVRSDAMWVRTESGRTQGLNGAEGDVSRFRLILEGERVFEAGEGATFTPTGEVGLRHDGGDAETGTGVELGAGVRYASGRVTVEGRVHGLVAHGESGYEEWGASGAVIVAPDAAGRGFSLSVAPAWGNAGSGTGELWSRGFARGLGTGRAFGAESRLEARMGYGMALFGRRFLGTPEVGLGLAGSHRQYSVGWRLGLMRRDRVDVRLGLEAARDETLSDNRDPEDRIGLRATARW